MNDDPLDPTILTREQWQKYKENARRAFHANPRDREAFQAMQQADVALEAYDQAEAAGPGERIMAGVRGGLSGLAHVPGDVVSGTVNTALGLISDPTGTIKSFAQVPGAIAQGLSSESDPETVSRTVGNLGAMLAPGAKARVAGTGSLATPGSALSLALRKAPTVGGEIGRAARLPFRAGRALEQLPIAKAEELSARARYYDAQAARVRSPGGGWQSQALEGERPVLPDTPANELYDRALAGDREAAAALERHAASRPTPSPARSGASPAPEAKPISEGSPGSATHTAEPPTSQPLASTVARKQAGHSEAWLARRNAMHGIRVPGQVAPAESTAPRATASASPLEGALQSSIRLGQLLKGPVSAEAQQEVLQIMQGGGVRRAEIQALASPSWKAVLGL